MPASFRSVSLAHRVVASVSLSCLLAVPQVVSGGIVHPPRTEPTANDGAGDVGVPTTVEATGPVDAGQSAPATLSRATPTAGLVAYYPFNGNANDESGNGHHGTNVGGTPTSDRNGRANSAYYFDGSSYIRGDASGFPTAERTVSAWFYSDALDCVGCVVFAYGGGSCGTSWFMDLKHTETPNSFHLESHCNLIDMNHPHPAEPVGRWYHWAITTSAGGTTMYVDGVRRMSKATFVNNTFVAGKDFSIGVAVSSYGTTPYTDLNVGYFKGKIDDLRVYNRALSDAEIRQLYEEEQASGAPVSWGPGRIAAVFTDHGADSGIWSHDGSNWIRLTDWQPAQMIGYGATGIMAAFGDRGSGNGLYRYDGSTWSRLSEWVPGDLVAYAGGDIAGRFSDYGSGNGIWRYNGSWIRLTDWLPDSMVALGGDTLIGLFLQYGDGNGLWRHDGSNWSRITDWTPDSMSAWGARLVATFMTYGSGNGVWIYEGGSWRRATAWTPASVLSWKGGTRLSAVFGNQGADGNGIWDFDGSSWARLTNCVPVAMAALGPDDLVAVFKDYGPSGNGIWKYSGTSQSWQRITDWVPDRVTASGDYLTAVFSGYGASGNGVWKYRGGGWSRLTEWMPERP